MFAIIIGVLVAAVFIGSIAMTVSWFFKEQALLDYDDDQPDSAIADMCSMVELKRNPRFVQELRGKVDLVGYNPNVQSIEGRNRSWQVAESFIVDINGRIHTLEKVTRPEGIDARVETNARWLAKQLDVEFRQ